MDKAIIGSSETGRTVTWIAIAVSLALAALSEQLFPGSSVIRRALVIATLTLCCAHLYTGYRGFRWIVAGFLVWAALRWGIRLVGEPEVPLEFGSILTTVLSLVAVLIAICLLTVLGVTRFLDEQRRSRGFNTPWFLLAGWMVIGSAYAVLIWADAGIGLGL